MQIDNKSDDKKKALEWAEKNLIGRKVYNKSLETEILFTRQGIKHAISSRIYPKKIAIVYDLIKLIEKAILIDISSDKQGRKDVKKVFKLFSEWKFDGKSYLVYMVVRLMNDNHIYYDHEIIKEKNLN